MAQYHIVNSSKLAYFYSKRLPSKFEAKDFRNHLPLVNITNVFISFNLFEHYHKFEFSIIMCAKFELPNECFNHTREGFNTQYTPYPFLNYIRSISILDLITTSQFSRLYKQINTASFKTRQSVTTQQLHQDASEK